MDPVEMAYRLHNARGTLRNFWRAEYAQKVQPWREIIRSWMAASKRHPIAAMLAGISRAREMGREFDGMALAMLMAAAVDELEATGGPDAQAAAP